MIFGWRGALGVTAGILTNLNQSLLMLGVAELAVIGAALGFMSLVAVWVYSGWTGLTRPWFGIQARHLLLLATLSAAFCSLSFYTLLVSYGVDASRDAVSRSFTMMAGDNVGAALLMATLVGGKTLFRRAWQRE